MSCSFTNIISSGEAQVARLLHRQTIFYDGADMISEGDCQQKCVNDVSGYLRISNCPAPGSAVLNHKQ